MDSCFFFVLNLYEQAFAKKTCPFMRERLKSAKTMHTFSYHFFSPPLYEPGTPLNNADHAGSPNKNRKEDQTCLKIDSKQI